MTSLLMLLKIAFVLVNSIFFLGIPLAIYYLFLQRDEKKWGSAGRSFTLYEQNFERRHKDV